MKISFENPDKVNGKLTLIVEEEDYKEKVEKKLKEYRQKAKVPGFRPGHVPMGLIKRQFGTAIKVDEVNKLLGEGINKYIQENKIAMLGEPLPSAEQEPQDLEAAGPYEFSFDIAVAPEFTVSLSKSDKVPYYDIEVSDDIVSSHIEMLASQNGHYEKAEEYDEEKRDRLIGDLRQLDAEGNTLEGGITVADAQLMPKYIKVEEQKALFDNAKLGDIITFNPKKAYPDSDAEVAGLLKMKKEEVAELDSDFSFQVTEISRYESAPVDQKLFDQVLGEGAVASEEEFRERIAEGLKPQFVSEADFKFLQDVRKYVEDKVGELTFPDELLKRIMKNNNKNMDEKFIEEHFVDSLRDLKWHLIKNQLVDIADVHVDDAAVKATAVAMARAQFAQYGMDNLPDDYLEKYAEDLLKKKEYFDRIVDSTVERALTQSLKNIVTLDVKKVSLEEFQQIGKE
ncbi:MAG: trigger factor [Prevotella sp.]|nr:trigger factor [Prevotella sp.]